MHRLRLCGLRGQRVALVDRLFRPGPHRSRRLGRVAVLCFFWLSWIDRILDPRHTIDGASSVFFLGRKSEVSITEADIIDYYQGGMSEIAVRDRA